MLLKSLYDYAHSRKLLDDLAFAPKAIRWVIPLDREGNLIGQGPIDTSEDAKRGKEFLAPLTGRPKVAGGIAEFLADGITALFGLDMEPDKDKDNERRRKDRDANNIAKRNDFWRQIRRAFDETKHPALSSLLKLQQTSGEQPPFLTWKASAASEKRAWWLTTAGGAKVKLKPDNFSFKVEDTLLLEDEALRDWWRQTYQREVSERETESTPGLCLITGRDNVPIATTHTPKIKGIKGAQAVGAALVSFDKPAFASYGFDQSYNAPASIEAATAYCVALNHLLATRNHSLRVGAMTVCFWARDSEEATDVFAWAFDQPKPESVREFLRSPLKGRGQALAQPDEFYSVTLSGNGGRVVVRHWMQMSVEAAVQHVRQWFSDLEIVAFGETWGEGKARRNPKESDTSDQPGKPERQAIPPLALFRLACTTVREAKDLQAEVPAQLYRAALEGIAPPLSLIKPILNRFEIDLVKNGPNTALRNLSRFALLRLIINRQLRKEGKPEMQPKVCETDDEAYNCGRLLAVFDNLQMAAHEYKLEGAGVVERYYGSASSAPNSAFGILWRLHQHHLKRLSRLGDRGKAASEAIKRRIAEIACLFAQPKPNAPPAFPRTFSLQEQGRFALGFYQQKAEDDAARRAHGKDAAPEKGGS
ncbi:MAG TPA: type I-C CRISPR-associated protein Cas8c/Csd1 [Blastocatellia bacterium]|nr:type I-C CRISPR-associated protein Cas8c/Csd1 [Blastocatellia bacterium]